MGDLLNPHGDPDGLVVAYRAHVERIPPKVPTVRTLRAMGWPPTVLVVDTETSVDPSQRLLFGSWRYGEWGADGTFNCLEEGIFFDDELQVTDPTGWTCLQTYVQTHRADTRNRRRADLLFLSRREFVNQRFWKALDAGALVVGYNLPFDLTRLAVGWSEARHPLFRGGFSLPVFEYEAPDGTWRENPRRPRIRLKQLDSKRALMGVARRKGARDEERQLPPEQLGRFLDLKALVFALTDRHLSLAAAGEIFGCPGGKEVVEEHGHITEEYIDYNRGDVRLTAALLAAVRVEWDRHPVALSPDKVMSPAGVAKGYLRALGLVPPAVKFANVPAEFHGKAMSGYYGGRTWVGVRRTPVPVVYLDFLSMYPSVNALFGLWSLLIAERVHLVDATAEIQHLGNGLRVEECFDPQFWKQLVFFARIRPAGDVLPVRARYDAASNGTSIGVNPLESERPIWVAGPDLLASWVMTGRWPEVLEAIRLTPEGMQEGLSPVSLRGEIMIDPVREDFFRRIVEARQEVKGRVGLPEEERTRLSRFLKVLALSGSYGIYAELNPQPAELAQGDPAIVYAGDAVFETTTKTPEDAGEFCFPPFAALTTAGARLMLALLEHAVEDQGGTIAFGDTDSAAVVATRRGGPVPCRTPDGRTIHALSRDKVGAIVAKFAALNPYDRSVVPGSILKIEDVNFDADGHQRQIYAFAISAKRYALFVRTPRGGIRVVEAKEHGLGHLMAPVPRTKGTPSWIVEAWEALIREPDGGPLVLPAWADLPAVSRISVGTPTLLATYEAFNAGKSFAEQVKPENFGLSVMVAHLGHGLECDPQKFQLIGPYENDSTKWLDLVWINKYDPESGLYRIGVGRRCAPDRIQVKSYRDVLLEYRVHPEPKSLGPDGRVCHRGTVGLLQRRPVRVAETRFIGKESNAREQVAHGLVHDLAEVRAQYQSPQDTLWARTLQVLRRLPVRLLARRAGCSERMIKYLRQGTRRPSRRVAGLLIALAREQLIPRS